MDTWRQSGWWNDWTPAPAAVASAAHPSHAGVCDLAPSRLPAGSPLGTGGAGDEPARRITAVYARAVSGDAQHDRAVDGERASEGSPSLRDAKARWSESMVAG